MKKIRQRFKIIIALGLLSWAIVLLSSCASHKAQTSITKTQTDSVQVSIKTETAVRDCTIVQLPSTSEMAVDLDTDSCGNIKPFDLHLANDQTVVSVKATGKNKLTLKLHTSGQVNRWRKETTDSDSLLSHQQSKAETKYIVRVQTEYKTPWYNMVIIVTLAVITLLLLGYILINRFWKS